MFRYIKCFLTLLLVPAFCCCQGGSRHYRNPVIYADISDPDVIAADGAYWMTASSFNCCPGLLIYKSDDLVHWTVVNSALPGGLMYQYSTSDFKAEDSEATNSTEGVVSPHFVTQHGNGVWAPSIRCHDGVWWIFWGDPDYGIYQVHTDDPEGEWSEPHCVISAKGMIDPCPLWDDDGRVWLIHAWAKSRCGFKSILSVCELNADCTECISGQTTVFDGNINGNETVEGSKFYKRNGKYVVMAPAGGVKTGWQLMMQADSPFGPYDWRVVMHQGDCDATTFGPHQGGWVDDSAGQSWFLHFEDRYAYGRVLHLQPLHWLDDGFCIIGEDTDGDGIGEPVAEWNMPHRAAGGRGIKSKSHRKFTVGNGAVSECLPKYEDTPPYIVRQTQGVAVEGAWDRLWDNPNLVLQMIEGPSMTYECRVDVDGSRVAGIVVLGDDYSCIEVGADSLGLYVRRRSCFSARKGGTETVRDIIRLADVSSVLASASSSDLASVSASISDHASVSASSSGLASVSVSSSGLASADISYVTLRVCINEVRNFPERIYDRPDNYIALCVFEYSLGDGEFQRLGEAFPASAGRWIGARVGGYSR